MKKIVLIIVALIMSGCASNHKFYQGPKLAESEIAKIKGASGKNQSALGGGYTNIQIRGLNGKEIQPENMMANSVEVLPGNYNVEVMVTNQNFFQTATFDWAAIKSKQYIVQFETGEGHDNVNVLNIKKVWLEDAITGEVIKDITDWSIKKSWIFKSNVTIYM